MKLTGGTESGMKSLFIYLPKKSCGNICRCGIFKKKNNVSPSQAQGAASRKSRTEKRT